MTEDERDAHLREALRHAPDAQVLPPPSVSSFILNEARAKARDASPPARNNRFALAALWHWLARPSVATGLAGVMAATLVGMMWWGQPMDEAMPRRPEPSVTSAPAAPAAAPPPAIASAPAAPAQDAARPEPAPPRAALRKSAGAVDKAEPARETAPAAAPAAAPPPAPMPAPATAAVAPPAQAAAEMKEEIAREQRTRSAKSEVAGAAPRRELNDLRQRLDGQSHATLFVLRTSIAAEPARWTWQRDGDAAQPMNDAVSAWLSQLDAATERAWQPRTSSDTAPPLGRELRLLRDGQVQHTLRLTERGVLWEGGPSSWQAALPLATLHALEASAP
jgi:hypothetical protein